jgi:AraC-like DNA-binding protein
MRECVRVVDRAEGRLSIGEAARLVGMSRTSFVRWFKRVTGQTFNTYLTHLRLARAQHYLLTTEWKISDIAQRTGFPEESYFCRVFRRVIGVSPGRYRGSRRERKRGAASQPVPV